MWTVSFWFWFYLGTYISAFCCGVCVALALVVACGWRLLFKPTNVHTVQGTRIQFAKTRDHAAAHVHFAEDTSERVVIGDGPESESADWFNHLMAIVFREIFSNEVFKTFIRFKIS
jgi:hypothetical protein